MKDEVAGSIPANGSMKIEHTYFTFVSVLFVAVLMISNIASTKIVTLFNMTFDAGTLLFPLSYMFADILTEVYGFRKTRQVIWYGFCSLVLMMATFFVVGLLPSASIWEHQDAYDAIFSVTPFIVLGSVLAYLSGSFTNAYVLAKMKVYTRGKHLWARTIGSTIVGQGVDTIVFVLVAFSMVLPYDILVSLIVANYVFKVGVEVLFTPVTYQLVRVLKKEEGTDVYDTHTRFSVFG